MLRGKGEGSWRTRTDGRLEYALPIGKTANGNTKRRSFYGSSKKEVLAQVERWRKRNFEFEHIEPTAQTLNEFFRQHLEHREVVQKRISALTREDYSLQYKRYIEDDLGAIHLVDIKPSHVAAWQTRLARGNLSTRTLDYAYRILKSCLEFATRLRIIPFNPMAGLPAPKVERSAKNSFTRAEAQAYLQASSSQRLEALFLLVLTTGLRRSELLGLRWQDVELVHLEIRVRQRLRWKRGGGFDIAPPKTTCSRRTIPIASDVAEALKRWSTQQQLERAYAGSAWEEFGLVFTTQIGRPVHSITVSDAHRAVLKDAGLRHLTFHELRHSFTSLARADGIDLKVISEILGHSSVAFTADFYQHTFDDMRREVAKTAQELLGTNLNAPVLLEPDRLTDWLQLVEWLANRPNQGAQVSAIPKRLRGLLEPGNAAERDNVQLVCHVKRQGWCLHKDYEARLKLLEKN